MTYSVSKDREQNQVEPSRFLDQTMRGLILRARLATSLCTHLRAAAESDSRSFDSCGHFRHVKIKRSTLHNTGVHFCGAFVEERMDK